MNGNVFWSGLGGCLGCFITSQFGISYGLLPVYIMGCFFIITSILNVLSVPELSLRDLRLVSIPTNVGSNLRGRMRMHGYEALIREANLVEQENMKMRETICAIIRIPMPLFKLGVAGFIAMYLNIIPYIWFTHQYAEVIFRADKEYLRQGSQYAQSSQIGPVEWTELHLNGSK